MSGKNGPEVTLPGVVRAIPAFQGSGANNTVPDRISATSNVARCIEQSPIFPPQSWCKPCPIKNWAVSSGSAERRQKTGRPRSGFGLL